MFCGGSVGKWFFGGFMVVLRSERVFGNHGKVAFNERAGEVHNIR